MYDDNELYEAECGTCELTFDVWVVIRDGQPYANPADCVCPNCMRWCGSTLREKEGLA